MTIPYYQERGKKYPQQRQHKEIINFKPNSTDYNSDETNDSQKEKTSNVKAIIYKNLLKSKRLTMIQNNRTKKSCYLPSFH